MTIVAVDPKDWAAANVVQVDSDAKDNPHAIDEIEEWAAKNGFARVNENWLRQILRNGHRVFRGVCYRLTEQEQQGSASIRQANAEALGKLPETPHLVDADR